MKKLSPQQQAAELLKKAVADRISKPINDAVNKAVHGRKVQYKKAGRGVHAPRASDVPKSARDSFDRESRAIHNAASRLGKLGRGVPKNLTDDERDARRDRMAYAQEFRWSQ